MMKTRLLAIGCIVCLVLVLVGSGCGKKDATAGDQGLNPMDLVEEPKEEVVEPVKPVELEATPENSSQKWQQMVALDLNTLEMGQESVEKGAVHVVAYHPQGRVRRIDEVDELNVTFSQPVAPLKRIVKGAPSLIQIDPPVKGEGYWKSSTTYCFRVDEKLKLSSRYKVKFLGYQSFNGKIAKAMEWEFTTPTITIRNTKPYYNGRYQTLDQKVLVRFSQDVDPDDIEDFIEIGSPEGKHKFKIRYADEKERKLLYYWAKEDKDAKQYITITSKSDYPIASKVQVLFKKGLPSKHGNAGMAGARELTFYTYEVFKVESVAKSFQPDRGIEVRFSNPVPVKAFIEKLKFEPPVKLNPEGDWNSRTIYVHGNFQPGTTYKLTIPADVQDQFGNTLPQDVTEMCECLDFTPYLFAPRPMHFVLESDLDKVIPVNVRNIFESKVSYKKLTWPEIVKLSDYNYLDPGKVDKKSLKTFGWDIPVVKNRDYTLPFHLSKINSKKPGFYYIKFENATRSYYDGNVFQLTNIALVAKFSPSQVFVVPFNLKTGETVSKMEFSLVDAKSKGAGFATFKGDKKGIAAYTPSLQMMERHPLLDSFVFSKKPESFVWGRKSSMFDMWHYHYTGVLDYNSSPSPYYNHMLAFTDKYLYKGGQIVKFKGIARQIRAGQMTIPAMARVEGEVFNSREEKIHTFTILGNKITSFGSFAGSFKLPDDAPTGFYRIHLRVLEAKETFERDVQFSVEEYKPAKFETKVTIDQKMLVAGQDLSGTINGRYLFGTPMRDAKGDSSWTLQSTYFTPNGWQRYSFGTPESSYRNTIHKGAIKLDGAGNAKFKRNKLQVPGKNSARLTVYGEIQDKDNNRISGSSSIMVHRGEFYIGLKTGSYFFKQGKPGKIAFVTVRPNGKLNPETRLYVKITRDEWKSFQKKDASGALRWEWQRSTEEILEETLSLPKGQLEKEYSFKKPGYYTVTLTGEDNLDNMVTTSGHFYVTGSGYVSWGVNEGRTIDLVTDKNSYKPGETVELLVKSPFKTSTVLVTVEREKVMWSKVVRLKGNADTIKIPVREDFMPNVYTNVIILKERTGVTWDEEGNDTGKPEFYAGYKEIDVDAARNKLNVKVAGDQSFYEPGSPVSLDIEVTDWKGNPVSAEVCLSIVDKGVLNLVGYELPDPFSYFWKDRPLDVKTVSTLSDVLGRRQFKEKGENPGGDGGLSPFGSVVVRKNFKESAYYSAFVNTDKNGKATIKFTLPENLTTFKAMAVAGTKLHKFGRGNANLLVKKKLILKPAIPDFARLGDHYSAGVTVTNNTDAPLSVEVMAEYQDIARQDGDPDIKSVTLKAAETQVVWFKFKVESPLTAKLTFKAVAAGSSDGIYMEVPVRMPEFMEAVANYGRVDTEPVKEQIIVPNDTFRNLDTIEFTLASSAMVGVKRNFDVLNEYPYDCLEQRISKQYPLLGAGDFLLEYGLLDMKPEDITKRIQTLLDLMPKYQAGSGGFKYYPDSIFSSHYLTCYTMEFALEAKRKGYTVDAGMVKAAMKYLEGVAKLTINSKYPYSRNIRFLVQAYASYILSLDGKLPADVVNNLFEVRDRIPFSGLAYLVKALEAKNQLPKYMQPAMARAMMNKMKDEPTMTHFENHEDRTWWCVHGSNVKTTSIVLEALLTVYKRFPYAEKIARWLSTTTNQKRYMSTQDHIRLFLAFERYYRVFEADTPDFVAKVLFKDQVKITEQFKGRDLKARLHEIPLKEYWPGETLNLSIQKEGTGMLYYLLRMKYFPKGLVEAIDRGFEVKKVYKDLEGNEVKDNRFKAGQKYIVEVMVTTKMERPFVILDDPLPAGLKVLNPRFKTNVDSVDNNKANRDNPWGGYWGNFYRAEYYFDRVEVFADYLARGTHTWTYLAIATNEGRYTVPNTVVMEMYNPEVFGRNDNRDVEVFSK
jgi:uncharacterized protein YfaS (alpha-2-macroglobulin family)